MIWWWWSKNDDTHFRQNNDIQRSTRGLHSYVQHLLENRLLVNRSSLLVACFRCDKVSQSHCCGGTMVATSTFFHVISGADQSGSLALSEGCKKLTSKLVSCQEEACPTSRILKDSLAPPQLLRLHCCPLAWVVGSKHTASSNHGCEEAKTCASWQP